MILLTRKTRTLAKQLQALGYSVTECALLSKHPLALTAEQIALQNTRFQHVFVGSRFVARCWPLERHAQATFWAPGAATGQWLAQRFQQVQWPSTGEGVAALEPPAEGRWLILTAQGGRSIELVNRVAQADVVELYRTSINRQALKTLQQAMPTTIVVSSLQAANAIVDLPLAKLCRYIVSSNHVAEFFAQHGVTNLSIAGSAQESAFLQAIVSKDSQ